MPEVPDEMWVMIDRMREVVRDVWTEGRDAGFLDYERGELTPNPYEGKESMAKVFAILSPDVEPVDEREVGKVADLKAPKQEETIIQCALCRNDIVVTEVIGDGKWTGWCEHCQVEVTHS